LPLHLHLDIKEIDFISSAILEFYRRG